MEKKDIVTPFTLDLLFDSLHSDLSLSSTIIGDSAAAALWVEAAVYIERMKVSLIGLRADHVQVLHLQLPTKWKNLVHMLI